MKQTACGACEETFEVRLRLRDVLARAKFPVLCEACRVQEAARALVSAVRRSNSTSVRSPHVGKLVDKEGGRWSVQDPRVPVGMPRRVGTVATREEAYLMLRRLLDEAGVDWERVVPLPPKPLSKPQKSPSPGMSRRAVEAWARALEREEARLQASVWLGKESKRHLLAGGLLDPRYDATHVRVPGREKRMDARLLLKALTATRTCMGMSHQVPTREVVEAVRAALELASGRGAGMYVTGLESLGLVARENTSLGMYGRQSTLTLTPAGREVNSVVALQRHAARLFVRVKHQRHRTSEAKSQLVLDRVKTLAPNGEWVTRQDIQDGWDVVLKKDTLQWHLRRLAGLGLVQHERHHPKGLQRGSVSRARVTDAGRRTERVADVYLVKPRRGSAEGAQRLLDRLRALAPDGEWVSRKDVFAGWDVSWCKDTYQEHARHLIDMGLVEREYYAAHRGSVSRLRLTPRASGVKHVLGAATTEDDGKGGARWKSIEA